MRNRQAQAQQMIGKFIGNSVPRVERAIIQIATRPAINSASGGR